MKTLTKPKPATVEKISWEKWLADEVTYQDLPLEEKLLADGFLLMETNERHGRWNHALHRGRRRNYED